MILKYFLFKEKLSNIIQNSNLNIGEVYFILKDIFHEVEKLYYQCVNVEMNETNNQTEEDNSFQQDINELLEGEEE